MTYTIRLYSDNGLRCWANIYKYQFNVIKLYLMKDKFKLDKMIIDWLGKEYPDIFNEWVNHLDNSFKFNFSTNHDILISDGKKCCSISSLAIRQQNLVNKNLRKEVSK